MKKIISGKLLTAAACALFSMAIFVCTPIVSQAYTQTTGIVSADAAKVRKEPTTSSDVVVGLLKGSTVAVTDEVTDSAGMVWYKVTADNSTGYIRSDLLIKATSSTGATTNNNSSSTTGNTANNTNNNNETEQKPAATTATPIAETKAYINYESVRVREGASTNHEIVGSAAKNTGVTITGEAKANDGKKWYQIKYTTSAGRAVVGFVRADLVTVGEPPAATPTPTDTSADEPTETEGSGEEAEPEETGEVPEEEVEQPVEPEEEIKPDYEMVYTQNNEGENEWYLYDNINGTRQTLTGLMQAAEAGAAQEETEGDQLAIQKIVIIVLAVVTVILAIAVTLLLFKIRDFYEEEEYEDEEDEDEDEDDEDEDEDDDDEEEDEPIRKRSSIRAVKPSKSAKADVPSGSRATPDEKIPVFKSQGVDDDQVQEAPQVRKKAKNFLIDDDEFEFEFLNMDDRD